MYPHDLENYLTNPREVKTIATDLRMVDFDLVVGFVLDRYTHLYVIDHRIAQAPLGGVVAGDSPNRIIVPISEFKPEIQRCILQHVTGSEQFKKFAAKVKAQQDLVTKLGWHA